MKHARLFDGLSVTTGPIPMGSPPATDTCAHRLRWLSLIAAIGLIEWAARVHDGINRPGDLSKIGFGQTDYRCF
jgi:hypothetical protein